MYQCSVHELKHVKPTGRGFGGYAPQEIEILLVPRLPVRVLQLTTKPSQCVSSAARGSVTRSAMAPSSCLLCRQLLGSQD